MESKLPENSENLPLSTLCKRQILVFLARNKEPRRPEDAKTAAKKMRKEQSANTFNLQFFLRGRLRVLRVFAALILKLRSVWEPHDAAYLSTPKKPLKNEKNIVAQTPKKCA
jgi:hypothetical protein